MCAVFTDYPRIIAPRLTLRPPAPADAPRLTRLIDDFGVARMTSRVPHPYGPGDAQTFFDGLSKSNDDWRFAVEHPDYGFIGVISLDRREGAFRELGYWLGRPFWGRGYATEAACALLQWARDARDLRAAAAGHFEDNPTSGRVLDKAGFLYTGVVEPRFSKARGAVASTRMMVWMG